MQINLMKMSTQKYGFVKKINSVSFGCSRFLQDDAYTRKADLQSTTRLAGTDIYEHKNSSWSYILKHERELEKLGYKMNRQQKLVSSKLTLTVHYPQLISFGKKVRAALYLNWLSFCWGSCERVKNWLLVWEHITSGVFVTLIMVRA